MSLPTNGRYYLHRRLKPFLKVRAKLRIVELPTDKEPTLSIQVRAYLLELAGAGYNIQHTIPD